MNLDFQMIIFGLLILLPAVTWISQKVNEMLHSRRANKKTPPNLRNEPTDARTLERREARIAMLKERMEENRDPSA